MATMRAAHIVVALALMQGLDGATTVAATIRATHIVVAMAGFEWRYHCSGCHARGTHGAHRCSCHGRNWRRASRSREQWVKNRKRTKMAY